MPRASLKPPKIVGGVRWKPDEDAPLCDNCRKNFSLFRRRHHCRACGGVFCAACSGRRMFLDTVDKVARVCVECDERKNAVALPVVEYAERPVEPMQDSDPPTLCIDQEYGSDDDIGTPRVPVASISTVPEEVSRDLTFFIRLEEAAYCRIDAEASLTVVMSPQRGTHQTVVVSLAESDSMAMVVERLTEPYARLWLGPFQRPTDAHNDVLKNSLRCVVRGSTILPTHKARDVRRLYARVVMTHLPAHEALELLSEPSVRLFIQSEQSDDGPCL